MIGAALALLLLVTASWVWPHNAVSSRLAAVRRAPVDGVGKQLDSRLLPAIIGVAAGAITGLLAWQLSLPVALVGWWVARRAVRQADPVTDPLDLAASWDLLSACLRAGLPVSTAVGAIARTLPGDAGNALRATASLLALGANPVDAWQPAAAVPATAPLARAARRTARSGSAMAKVAASLADEVRAMVTEQAEARAHRAGVLIAGPLGLCFLPAFLCLGVAPIVLGMAGRLTQA